ncbi:uncharacterized protein LOC107630405 isoform X4 [Arachis ipaensis]|uniref:uncharacterized protein LOC107630405 isoform X4 n=1 Tax=Arachis ipaensis TaxID=130454 RepID=UPI000A2B38BF|nr:uncharacterized protein LOC107630405 isoform X4 [Arachis ipaensis]
MTWRRLLEPVAAHASLLCFTALLLLKLHHRLSLSWWIIFFPLWIFHAIVARGRFSLPGLSARHNQNWATGHAVVAMRLLTAFELLLCIYLESICVRGAQVVNMKIVFLPLLIFEIIILMENFRLCRALMPGDEENMSAEHFSVAISRVFFITATIFTLLKLSGDLLVLSWWDLFVNLAIVECFAFLVCTKWSNLVTSGLVVSSERNRRPKRMCNMQDIIMEVPVIVFQILICRYLEGAPACAKKKPAPSFFSFLLQLQSAGVMFAASALVEKLILLLNSGAAPRIYSRGVSRVHDCYLGLLYHGSRFLGWFSIAERSQEEQEKLDCEGSSGDFLHCASQCTVIIRSLATHLYLRSLRKCLKRILLKRFGDCRQLLVSRQKLQNAASGSMKGLKMRKYYAEFVFRERLALYYFHAGIAVFAAHARRNARTAQSAATIL